MFHHDLFARISLLLTLSVSSTRPAGFCNLWWFARHNLGSSSFFPHFFFYLKLFYYGDRVIVVGRRRRRRAQKARSFFIIRKFMLWKVSLNVESCGSHYLGVYSMLLLCWALSGVRVAVVESVHDWLRCYNCLALIVCLFVCIIGLTWLSSMLARSSAAVYSIHWSARRQWFNSTMRCVYIRLFSQ